MFENFTVCFSVQPITRMLSAYYLGSTLCPVKSKPIDIVQKKSRSITLCASKMISAVLDM